MGIGSGSGDADGNAEKREELQGVAADSNANGVEVLQGIATHLGQMMLFQGEAIEEESFALLCPPVRHG